jgi:chromosome partitioning protein
MTDQQEICIIYRNNNNYYLSSGRPGAGLTPICHSVGLYYPWKAGENLTVICFVNQKGGVGKTASVVNIGAGLAKLNKRVLLIDLDPQESLSYWLGIDKPKKTVYDFFDGTASLSHCKVSHSSGLDVVTSDEMLATVSPSIEQLKYGLLGNDYDYVLLDCSPTLGMLTLTALTASDWVIIPFCPDLLSIKGMTQLLGTITTVQEETNPRLQLKAVIATRFNPRKRMHREVLDQIRDFFRDLPIFTVRENIAISESPVNGQSVLDYRPNSAGAADYYEIARELTNVR